MVHSQQVLCVDVTASYTPHQVLCVESLITLLLVLVVFSVAGDPGNKAGVKGSAPLAIGDHSGPLLTMI